MKITKYIDTHIWAQVVISIITGLWFGGMFAGAL